MEKQILSALTAFISNEKKEGRLTGPLFNKLTDGQIKGIWNDFDQLASFFPDNHEAIFRDLAKYVKDEVMDFGIDETIEIALLEVFLKGMLLKIDDQTYTLCKNGSLRRGRVSLTFQDIIDEIRTRAKNHIVLRDNYIDTTKATEMVAACSKLDDGRRQRNDGKGHTTGDNGELLKLYTTAFFVATLIYTNIKDILAGVSIQHFQNKNVCLQVKHDKVIIFEQFNLKYGVPYTIPVTKELFEDKTEIRLSATVVVPFIGSKTKDITVKRGIFQTNPIVMKVPEIASQEPLSSTLGEEMTLLQEKNRELERKIEELAMVKASLEKETDELKMQLQQQANVMPVAVSTNSASLDVVGIVHIKNTKTDAQCYLRINEGTNTYGTDADNGNHHQILLGLRGIDIKPKQFEIGQRNDRFFIRDLSNGGTLVDGQPIDDKGAYVTENTTVRVANYLEIHISKI